MKFKEFKVDTFGNSSLVDAVLEHAKRLGYKRFKYNGDYDYGVVFYEHGEFLTVNHEVDNVNEELSLDEFFSLTKDDVVEKTEWTPKGKWFSVSKDTDLIECLFEEFGNDYLLEKVLKQVKLTLLKGHLANEFNGDGEVGYSLVFSYGTWACSTANNNADVFFDFSGAEKACEILNNQPELWRDLV